MGIRPGGGAVSILKGPVALDMLDEEVRGGLETRTSHALVP